jgi:hypothetical protein
VFGLKVRSLASVINSDVTDQNIERSPVPHRFLTPIYHSRSRHITAPQSASGSLFTAGAFRFLNSGQSGERPDL